MSVPGRSDTQAVRIAMSAGRGITAIGSVKLNGSKGSELDDH